MTHHSIIFNVIHLSIIAEQTQIRLSTADSIHRFVRQFRAQLQILHINLMNYNVDNLIIDQIDRNHLIDILSMPKLIGFGTTTPLLTTGISLTDEIVERIFCNKHVRIDFDCQYDIEWPIVVLLRFIQK